MYYTSDMMTDEDKEATIKIVRSFQANLCEHVQDGKRAMARKEGWVS